jgi:hypothetical protein
MARIVEYAKGVVCLWMMEALHDVLSAVNIVRSSRLKAHRAEGSQG